MPPAAEADAWRRTVAGWAGDPVDGSGVMKALIIIVVVLAVLLLMGLALSVRIIRQYERGVVFRLGRLQGSRAPGLRLIIPVVDVLHRVSLRIVTMPIQSQGIITSDNVSVDV
jgi:regulator of protease activity HflC (stomatin/prohibitin superfamily)